MKIVTQCGPRLQHNRRKAFTLIEMIGVLAVIAILASMLIPRVFEAINSARVNATAVSCETVKTAAADHYGKYGKFDLLFGTNAIAFNAGISVNYDTNLMTEGLLDKPFSARIAGGDPTKLSILELTSGANANNGQGYALDGTTNTATSAAQFVLEAVIKNVSIADAKDLNDRIDGTGLGTSDLTSADLRGRVEYAAPSAGTTTVYVYLTHR